MPDRPVPAWPIIAAVLGALAGLLLGWWIWRPVSIRETAAPARELPSGGLVVERAPEAPVPKDTTIAAREAGGELIRTISVTVQPNPAPAPTASPVVTSAIPPVEAADPAAAPAPGCSCEPVTVDLGLVRMPDRTHRVVATARGGTILSAIDIPLEPATFRRARPWAAGLSISYDMSQRKAVGAWVDRDMGPFRVGLELSQRDGGTATLRAGVRF